MHSDPLIRKQMDADLEARLRRVTARTPRTGPSNSRPPVSPPLAPHSTTPPPPPPPGSTPARKKRRHPARHSRSAALVLSFVTTSGLAYAFAATDSGASATTAAPVGLVGATAPSSSSTATAPTPTAPVPSSTPATTTPITTTPATTTPATTTPATTTPATTPAAPKVVNGASFTNRYGNVQVQATFAPDGTIASVDLVQAPSRDGKSVEINNYAGPRLNTEALSAQKASVHTVSGATYTSMGYAQSLQSAIDIARANGITNIS